MLKLNFLQLGIKETVIRYYLMMALIIGGGFAGVWAIAFLGFPVFISAVLGIEFEWNFGEEKVTETGGRHRLA